MLLTQRQIRSSGRSLHRDLVHHVGNKEEKGGAELRLFPGRQRGNCKSGRSFNPSRNYRTQQLSASGGRRVQKQYPGMTSGGFGSHRRRLISNTRTDQSEFVGKERIHPVRIWRSWFPASSEGAREVLSAKEFWCAHEVSWSICSNKIFDERKRAAFWRIVRRFRRPLFHA